jgi:hypothetical protein
MTLASAEVIRVLRVQEGIKCDAMECRTSFLTLQEPRRWQEILAPVPVTFDTELICARIDDFMFKGLFGGRGTKL